MLKAVAVIGAEVGAGTVIEAVAGIVVAVVTEDDETKGLEESPIFRIFSPFFPVIFQIYLSALTLRFRRVSYRSGLVYKLEATYLLGHL